jgi:medium-chain acyl-[acyl-carrier-protein] hydrolase
MLAKNAPGLPIIKFKFSEPESPVLICLGHAGSGASEFRHWAEEGSTFFDVRAIRLPGRESRIKEACLVDGQLATAYIAKAITELDISNRQYGLYGQCSGAPIMLKVARILRAASSTGPAFICVGSAATVESLRLPENVSVKDVSGTPNFLETLQSLGGLPDVVMQNQSLADLILPSIVADLRLMEDLSVETSTPIDIPLISATGSRDPNATTATATTSGWEEGSYCPGGTVELDAGHFLTRSNPVPLFSVLQTYLRGKDAD